MFQKQIDQLKSTVERLKGEDRETIMMRRDQAEYLGVSCYHEGQRKALEKGYEPDPGVLSMVKVKVYDLYVILKKGGVHGVDWEDPNQGQGGDPPENLDQ